MFFPCGQLLWTLVVKHCGACSLHMIRIGPMQIYTNTMEVARLRTER